MDDFVSSPPEQADTEEGFGTGLRAQLARNQEARPEGREPDSQPPEPAAEGAPSWPAESPDGVDPELSKAFAHDTELLRGLSERHARLAEWVAAQGRTLKSPEAAGLLTSSALASELDRHAREAARLEAWERALVERETDLGTREQRERARTAEADRVSERRKLDVRQADLETRERALEDTLVAVEELEREVQNAQSESDVRGRELDRAADRLEARERGVLERETALDEREADLEARAKRLERREEALVELTDWLTRKERELGTYLADRGEGQGDLRP